ncbi:hypothetical protein L9F63_012346, partial [Diploptera punctata]
KSQQVNVLIVVFDALRSTELTRSNRNHRNLARPYTCFRRFYKRPYTCFRRFYKRPYTCFRRFYK